jgi:diguanylate cyclase (GGDEF)-like protein
MRLNNLRVSLLFFSFAYIISVFIFTFFSYRFFINSFNHIEEKINKRNITTFLKSVDKSLNNIKNITVDYALWDDTYKFVDDTNKEYIHENFRDGSNTLEDLQLNSIIISNNENKVLYSTYFDSLFDDNQKFEYFILNKLKEKKNFTGILTFNQIPFLLSKSAILKSDRSGISRGNLIIIKFLDSKELLLENESLFKTISFDFKKEEKALAYTMKGFETIKVVTQLQELETTNKIQFYDFDKQFLFSIKTINENLVISQGKDIIVVFNLIGSLILLVIFSIVFQNQRLILNQNKILNKKIIKRTRQLNRAYKNLKSKNRELFKIANLDALTGINNRASFFSRSINALKESNKSYSEFGVLIIDIDYFKKINDTYSHSVGDKVLKSFTQTVGELISEDMIFGRIGGEEFCITIYNKDEEDIYRLSEQIRTRCVNTPVIVDDIVVKYTVSIGIAMKKSGTQTIDEILHNADLMLYKAKESGRNRVIRR